LIETTSSLTGRQRETVRTTAGRTASTRGGIIKDDEVVNGDVAGEVATSRAGDEQANVREGAVGRQIDVLCQPLITKVAACGEQGIEGLTKVGRDLNRQRTGRRTNRRVSI